MKAIGLLLCLGASVALAEHSGERPVRGFRDSLYRPPTTLKEKCYEAVSRRFGIIPSIYRPAVCSFGEFVDSASSAERASFSIRIRACGKGIDGAAIPESSIKCTAKFGADAKARSPGERIAQCLRKVRAEEIFPLKLPARCTVKTLNGGLTRLPEPLEASGENPQTALNAIRQQACRLGYSHSSVGENDFRCEARSFDYF